MNVCTAMHAWVAAATLALGACASSPPQKPRTAAYLRIVEQRVEVAREQPSFVLRHNPTACDCPPFEVLLGETWQRVELVGVDEEDATILAIDAAIDTRPEAEVTIEGRLDGDLQTCGRGALYVSLVPTALVDPSSSESR